MKRFVLICLILCSWFNAQAEDVELIACDNSLEMVDWGLEFIKHAEHSIEFSPCFFGGYLFQDYMLAIEEQMIKHRKLQVHLFLSPLFLEPMNRDLLQRLQKRFPRQLHIAYTVTDLQFTSKDMVTTDNHINMLVVDELYFTTGGTNFDDALVCEGTKPRVGRQKQCAMGAHLASGARDQDVVGRSKVIATGLRTIFYQCFALWKEYNNQASFSNKDPASYKTNRYKLINDEQSIFVKKFETSPDLITLDCSHIEIVLGSPHQKSNAIKEKYIEEIDKAQSSIVIGNLHFAPVDSIMDALQRAAKRGVKITIITNGIHDRSPASNSMISWPNRVAYLPLLFGRNFCSWQKKQCESVVLNQVDFYEYYVDNILYHKKVMVVDDKTFVIGSYNLALRSDLCDYELNLIIHSKQVAKKALTILERDQRHSIKIKHEQIKDWYFDPLVQYKAAIQLSLIHI